jgi:hypothetical protein|tara:strand:+ start:4671 stop:4907 length:237 start_codon:yes stop_codon:yes gene_type:complete
MYGLHLTYDRIKKNWVLIKQGSKKPILSSRLKADARSKSVKLSRESKGAVSLKIHKKNGRFQEERTFPRSKDPSKTKG